jgi:hypothetical protein
MNDTNEKRQFDTSQPFLAIVPDEVLGDPYFDKTYGVYLVNPLERRITNVYERIGGFFSTEAGVIEAKPGTNGPFEVEPCSAHLLERTSYDEFAEFVCWWSITYELDGERHAAAFNAGKALRDTEEIDQCPILDRSALLVSR